MPTANRGVSILLSCLLGVSMVTASPRAASHEWPQHRGPGVSGASSQHGVFEAPAGVGLSVTWKQSLGSGYSGIVVAGGRVVTMFTDGKADIVAAFDEQTGKELWRQVVGDTEVGHDGSHDGPLSTPLIAGERVIGLGAQGTLFALQASTGEQLWSVNLVEAYEAAKPFYGFTTSPILAGGTVVVQVGGENNAVVGFDPATGKKKWSAGTDRVQYQTPSVIEHEGRQIVLAAGLAKLFAIEPGSGKLLWEWDYEGGGGGYGAPSLTPVTTGDNRLFLTHKDDGSKAVMLKSQEGSVAVETLWENNAIRHTYNTPVYHEGNIYSFSARFLTCVDAKTGKVKWRSREPGDGFLMLVDRHLVIVTKKGSLHVVKASPDGYEELAGLPVFDELAWAGPSFANGHVFVRSLNEIARINVGQGSTFAMAPDDPNALVRGTRFGKFLNKLEKATDKRAAVDRFMEGVERFPIVERDRAIFVYRGDADDVAVASEIIGVSQERSMYQVAGTDLFWYALRVTPDTRANYLILKDYEQMLDPLNPRTTKTTLLKDDMEFSFTGGAMEMSWFAMPQWEAPNFLGAADQASRGTIESHEREGDPLPGKMTIDVYLPAGYASSNRRYPVAYVHGGAPNARELGQWPTALDNLVGRKVEPLIVVFLSRSGLQVPQYVEYFASQIVPWVDEQFRTIADAEHRANIGQAGSAIPAFYCTFAQPGLVGKLGTQSAWLFEFGWTGLEPLVKRSDEQPLEIYMDWGTWDLHNPQENWHVGEINAEVAQFLRDRGYRLSGGEVHDSSGWASWSARTDQLLEALFPNPGG